VGEWATIIGVLGASFFGAIAAWIARGTRKDSLDEKFMSKLIARIQYLEEQNAKLVEQVDRLREELRVECGRYSELETKLKYVERLVEGRRE